MVKKATRRRGRFICMDCSVDTGKIHEFYYIKLELWLTVVDGKNGMLCIGCLETRLGRQLRRHDFTDASINDPRHGNKSTRLLQRLRAQA